MSAIILANAGEQIDQMRDKLLNADGAARKAAETMDDNLGGAFRSFMSSAEGAAIAVGEALAPALRQLTERLTSRPFLKVTTRKNETWRRGPSEESVRVLLKPPKS